MDHRDSSAHSARQHSESDLGPSNCPNPYEKALQSMCKQVLKSQFFRGFYEERRYVEAIKCYRDIVVLNRGERELEKVLLDIKSKFELVYQNKPQMWIGITNGKLVGSLTPVDALSTCIWTELSELAFGQYWFSIKSVRFRENEMIVKLKMVRAVAPDSIETRQARVKECYSQPQPQKTDAVNQEKSPNSMTEESISNQNDVGPQIDLQDFVNIAQQWGISIKMSLYEFISKDITKDNILGFLRFSGLLIVSLLTGLFAAIRFLGVFTLRFMFEVSRLTHALTPLTLKTLDVMNRIVGGFYILLAMIWRDSVGHRINPTDKAKAYQPALAYNQPMYRSIEYNVRMQQANLKQQNSNVDKCD